MAERRRENFRQLSRSFRVVQYGPGSNDPTSDPDPVPPEDLNEEERAEADSGQWVRSRCYARPVICTPACSGPAMHA